MGLTPDRNDPCLNEVDPDTGMPVRRSYLHEKCGTVTTMAVALAETYSRLPSFYGGTYCARCRGHYPVGASGEFVWADTDIKVGT